jgi:hypothetical protein
MIASLTVCVDRLLWNHVMKTHTNSLGYVRMFECGLVHARGWKERGRKIQSQSDLMLRVQKCRVDRNCWPTAVVSTVHCNVYYLICGTGLTLHS